MTEEQVVKGNLLLERINNIKKELELWRNCEDVENIKIKYNLTYNSTTEHTDNLTEIYNSNLKHYIKNTILKFYDEKLNELQKEFNEL